MLTINKIFCCYLTLFAVLQVCCAIYSDCGSKVGEVTGVEIEGCEITATRCILRRNTNVTFNLSFALKQEVSKVTAVVHGIVFHAPVPFNLPNPDGCVDSGLTCPISTGGPYTYTTQLPILKKYPKLSVDVKWQLQNEEDEDIVCLLIPAQVD